MTGPLRSLASVFGFNRDQGNDIHFYTKKDKKAFQKKQAKSFASLLPYTEYLQDSQTFMLEDGYSQALVYTIKPVPTEGRGTETLFQRRNEIQALFQSVIPERSIGTYVVQQYSYSDSEIETQVEAMRSVMMPHANGTQYSEHFLGIMHRHLKGISREDGIFEDQLTQKPWRGEYRRCKVVIYRRCSKPEREDKQHDPVEEIIEMRDQLESAMRDMRIDFKRDSGAQFFRWMLHWFNPENEYGLTRDELTEKVGFRDGDELPYGFDLSQALLLNNPQPNPDRGTWDFAGKPHRFIRVASFQKAPEIGQLTGEISSDDGSASKCFLDGLPVGSVICLTTVIVPQQQIENYVNSIEGSAKGDSSEVQRSLEAMGDLRNRLGRSQKVCRYSLGLFVRGDDWKDLKKKANAIGSSMLGCGLKPYKLTEDELALSAYIDHLPMVFDPARDPKNRMQRLAYTQHAVNLSLFWGREEGSGNPGLMFYNRAGSPLTFDQYGKDRVANAFGLIIGPPGSGKSASIVSHAAMTMAIHRPRMVFIEKGNSFGLLGDYFKANGLSVNKVSIAPNSGVHLPPFADSHLLFCSDDTPKVTVKDGGIDEDDQRDVMGEMETAALLMATGGEEDEVKRYGRAEKGVLRRLILQAAEKAFNGDYQLMTEHIRDELTSYSDNSDDQHVDLRSAMNRIAKSMDAYTYGFQGELFNTPAQLWPEVDVTIVDLGTLARDGYEAELAVAYIGLMQWVNNLGEKYQHASRDLVSYTDEAHIVLTSDLLARYSVKQVKMFRKLGVWPIFATQNLADFPKDAAKLLNMCEWWYMLNPTTDEVEQMRKFKQITDEQKRMMLSCTKQKRAYTEGIILSRSMPEMLFRSVPPSLHLALAMTDSTEKSERNELMKRHKCSEVAAAVHVAHQLDIARKIIPTDTPVEIGSL